jgi:hypothetical protein
MLFEKFGDPMTWIGNELACSPAIFTSAVWIGPQVAPPANTAHSAMGLPLPSVCWGNEIESAEDKILRPGEPVSTRIPLIVWQLVVLPGTQTVTLVKAPST